MTTASASPLPFFLLGAPDPEMDAIEHLLSSVGALFAFAIGHDGRRVIPGTAYAACWSRGLTPAGELVPVTGGVIAVECGPHSPRVMHGECGYCGEADVGFDHECDGHWWPVARCDHHRPGDPGAGKPPTEFLAGSSIGQVLAVLARHNAIPADWPRQGTGLVGLRAGEVIDDDTGDVEGWVVVTRPDSAMRWDDGSPRQGAEVAIVPAAVLMVAALDHCPAAACRGECPGVDAAEALAEFSRRSGCTPEEVEEARTALLAASAWDTAVKDLSWLTAPDAEPGQRGDRGALPGLRVALMIEGLAALARVRMPDGREKLVLQGAGAGTRAGDEPVRQFLLFAAGGCLNSEVGLLRVTGAYGDPVRGYAGAEVVRG